MTADHPTARRVRRSRTARSTPLVTDPSTRSIP